ncbi:type I 3-dehydroquinate dehydratase [Candidatus Bathyarchaeota archaeon]|nr:MAG: type I 3-dehydroquinate dehydratase [Candidatus Bathyarchaeota archaeon]
MNPKICVPLPATRISDLPSMIRRAEEAGADLIEIRLDYLDMSASDDLDQLNETIKEASVPLIATNRQYSQGGYRRQNEEQRVQTLIKAAEIGFQYVDVELTTANLNEIVRRIRDSGSNPIVSFHNFQRTPSESEMEKIVRSQIEAAAKVCKLVTKANNLADNINCLLFAHKMKDATELVCFAMGGKGILSRVLSPFFGAVFTFASLESTLETASGQISIADLRKIYRKLGVDL